MKKIYLPKKILEKKKQLSNFKHKRTLMLRHRKGQEWVDSNKKFATKRLELINLCIDYRLSYEEIGRLLYISKARVYQIYRYGLTGEITSKKRKVVLDRDNKRCLICRTKSRRKGDLQIHHIGDPKNNELSNLATLCMSCHVKVDHLKRNKVETPIKLSTGKVFTKVKRPIIIYR